MTRRAGGILSLTFRSTHLYHVCMPELVNGWVIALPHRAPNYRVPAAAAMAPFVEVGEEGLTVEKQVYYVPTPTPSPAPFPSTGMVQDPTNHFQFTMQQPWESLVPCSLAPTYQSTGRLTRAHRCKAIYSYHTDIDPHRNVPPY